MSDLGHHIAIVAVLDPDGVNGFLNALTGASGTGALLCPGV
ncbi:hypothetical protein [Actinacidiphila yeochonensis]|nr:hypothetical protein [Actinacidiphila yeochonensis]